MGSLSQRSSRQWFNPFFWRFRISCLAGFLGCLCLLVFALYVQFTDHLAPCPLCVSQRLAYAAVGVVFFIGAIVNPQRLWGRALWLLCAIAAALAGVALAARQVWLQIMPPQLAQPCGPSLDFVRDTQGIPGIIKALLLGTGDCSKVDWQLFGLSMPMWSLLCFLTYSGYALWIAIKR